MVRAAPVVRACRWWDPVLLGMYRCVRLVLLALRLDLPQSLLAAMAGVSRPTVSRVICAWTPVIARALAAGVPVVEDLDPAARLIIDGTLLPRWSWRNRPDLYPGRHRTTGFSAQVARTLSGHLAWVSDPLPGRVHDTAAIRTSGLLQVLAGRARPITSGTGAAPGR